MVCFIFEKKMVLINVNGSTLFHEIDFLEKFKPKYEAQNWFSSVVVLVIIFVKSREGFFRSNIPDFINIFSSKVQIFVFHKTVWTIITFLKHIIIDIQSHPSASHTVFQD